MPKKYSEIMDKKGGFEKRIGESMTFRQAIEEFYIQNFIVRSEINAESIRYLRNNTINKNNCSTIKIKNVNNCRCV